MGGDNNKDNLIKLTYREHFIAHWLLHLIYNEDKKLRGAFELMAYGLKKKSIGRYVPSSRILEENKIKKINDFKSEENQKLLQEKIRKTRLKNKVKNKKETVEKMLERTLAEYKAGLERRENNPSAN